MLLALDVGNTHVVVGLMEGREVRRSFRIATRRDNAVGDYAVALSQLLELAEVDRREVEQVIISSVVPPVTRALQGAARLLTGKEPLVVGGNVRCRIPVRIKRPETLGADLLTAAVGALDLYQPPLLLVDMGTATTVTVLDEQGVFRGGAILPGANLALSSLAGGTALLLDGLIDRMEAELGRKATVVATGGIAPVIAPACRHEMHMAADLILRGLAVLYEQNK